LVIDRQATAPVDAALREAEVDIVVAEDTDTERADVTEGRRRRRSGSAT
jgi:hypothetical protein